MAKCTYERCCRDEKLNEGGVCRRCAAILKRVRELIERGQLPKMPTAKLSRGEKVRVAPLRARDTGMPCAACDEPIIEQHWAYPAFPGETRDHDLHFHDLCDEIWSREAELP